MEWGVSPPMVDAIPCVNHCTYAHEMQVISRYNLIKFISLPVKMVYIKAEQGVAYTTNAY